MNKPGNSNYSPSPVRQPVLLGLFTGTAIGAGFLLAGVPNVELMTLITVLAGVTLGPWLGFACGSVAATAYSLGSPLGLPVPLLLAGQVLGLGFAGLVGSMFGASLGRAQLSGHRVRAMILAGSAGLVATFFFDLLTNLAILGVFDLNPLVVLSGAVPFALLHMGSNAAIFALLLPTLALRLRNFSDAPLRGEGQVLLGLLLLVASGMWASGASAQVPETPSAVGDSQPATILPDSLSRKQRPNRIQNVPLGVNGWNRGLWDPFAPTTLQWLDWRTNWLTAHDGGLGAPVLVLGEAGTGGNPEFERDGVPVGTGHALVDDPWLVSNQGLIVNHQQMGINQRTGAEGLISLITNDRDPTQAISLFRGVKGPHESYQRGFSLLTPRADWRVGFEFDESLDNEGYNFSDVPDEVFRASVPFPGHAKVRTSRTRLIRNLDPTSSLALEYSTGRKTKDSLPAWGADHQEIWETGSAATMKSRSGDWEWRTVVYWNSRDMRWGDRPAASGSVTDERFLETMREGVSFDLVSSTVMADTAGSLVPASGFAWEKIETSRRTSVGLRFNNWEVVDTGASWVTDPEISGSGSGRSAHLFGQTGRDLGPLRLQTAVTGRWDTQGGAAPGGAVSLSAGSETTRGKLELSHGGRAPSSAELLTPMERDVNGRLLLIQPNSHLQREKTLRLQALASTRILGLDLACDGSIRRLEKGITWVPLPENADTGRWSNDLELNSSRLTGTLGRQGRFMGWARVSLEGTWQSFDELSGKAVLLPPKKYLRLAVMWENHLFQEDGILQLALYSTRRGAMADPWDLTRTYQLPETTVHDLLLGFRLVGANLSLAIRNLTQQEVPLSAGAMSPGREMDMRLHWVFHY